MHVTGIEFLQFLTGGGLIGGAWKASAAVSEFRTAVQLLHEVLRAHLEDHPGPTGKHAGAVEGADHDGHHEH